MISVLDGSGDSLTAVLNGAPATTQPSFSVTWEGNGGPANPVGLLTGVAAKTLLAGVAGGPRVVKSLQVYNADTLPVVLTVAKVSGGVSYPLLNLTLPVGATLRWTEQDGVEVVDSAGGTTAETVGAIVAGIGVTVAESGFGTFRKTVLTLTDVPVLVGNTTAISFGGTKLYDFPTGRILVLGAIVDNITFDLTSALNVTPIDDTMGGDVAFGTTLTEDSTLDGTDVDLIPSTSIDPISGGIAGAALAASAQFDGTTTAKEVNINIIIDDADVADGASDELLVSGTLTIHWVLLGDY